MNIHNNPPDVPGFTQMYSFGIKLHVKDGSFDHTEYLVMTVRSATETMAIDHIVAVFRGAWKAASLQFYTDLEEWQKEAKRV